MAFAMSWTPALDGEDELDRHSLLRFTEIQRLLDLSQLYIQ